MTEITLRDVVRYDWLRCVFTVPTFRLSIRQQLWRSTCGATHLNKVTIECAPGQLAHEHFWT
jgi:hypothetical protein